MYFLYFIKLNIKQYTSSGLKSHYCVAFYSNINADMRELDIQATKHDVI